jgi:NAD-dependent SIR2 family protein deacetylase
MKVGNCPVCTNAYPHPESEGPAVVELHGYPGSVACVSCGRSWDAVMFRLLPALSVSTSPDRSST